MIFDRGYFLYIYNFFFGGRKKRGNESVREDGWKRERQEDSRQTETDKTAEEKKKGKKEKEKARRRKRCKTPIL